MNIALVILRADAALGGAERYTVDLAGALAGRGHRVSLAATELGQAIAGVTFVPLAARSVTRLGRYRRFLDSLDQHLGSCSYDVVHAMLPVRSCDVYHPHAGLAAEAMQSGHLKHVTATRRMLSRMGTQFNRKRAGFAAVERRLLTGPRPPLLLCLSEYVKSTVVEHYPALRPRLRTLFNAVDLGRFDPNKNPSNGAAVRNRLGIGPQDVVALMIAQDFARKGLGRAIQAMAQLKTESQLRLVVVGKQDPAGYVAMAGELKVSDRVIFAGTTTTPDDFYRAADFFVLPTRHDPCSLVVLESLAMGVPVISTVFNGACEIMEEGRHGFVLKDPDDVAALAAAMREMMDAARRGEMRQNCLALRPRLSMQTHLENLEAIYKTV